MIEHRKDGRPPEQGLDLHTRAALIDFVDILSVAESITARSKDAYDRDRVLQFAAETVIVGIADAMNRMSADFKAAHPKVPWDGVRGLRNISAHHYDLVNTDRVWQTIEQGLPMIGRLIGAIPPAGGFPLP